MSLFTYFSFSFYTHTHTASAELLRCFYYNRVLRQVDLKAGLTPGKGWVTKLVKQMQLNHALHLLDCSLSSYKGGEKVLRAAFEQNKQATEIREKMREKNASATFRIGAGGALGTLAEMDHRPSPEVAQKLGELGATILKEHLTSYLVGGGSILDLHGLALPSVDSLGDHLSTLGDLEELVLFGNTMNSLPSAIGQLSKLRWLDVSSCRLLELPLELQQLKQLEHLDASSNYISHFQLSSPLPYLQVLSLHHNRLKTLSADVFDQLPAAITVDLSFNDLARVAPLSGLKAVVTLNLQNNELISLHSSVKDASRLTELNLVNNHLDYLPLVLPDNLESLWLENNPLSTIPRAALQQGLKTLTPYLSELRKGSSAFMQVKLMFFGDGNVGKTSLLRCFELGKKGRKGGKKKEDPLDNVATDGIDIRSWTQDSLEFMSWDFAGQEVCCVSVRDGGGRVVFFSSSSSSFSSSSSSFFFVLSLTSFSCCSPPPVCYDSPPVLLLCFPVLLLPHHHLPPRSTTTHTPSL
jgi:Leucine rich repeat